MTNEDNSVNMAVKPRYHHGDLRAELIRIGLVQLDSAPVDALSLREVARLAGVSATAVYRHFPDKAALLGALCSEGDAALARAQRAAMAGAGGGQAGFIATGRAYVRFALAHPALFRLMMAMQGPVILEGAGPCDSGLAELRANIAALAPRDTPEAERRVMAVQAWSLVHGLAMLMLDGQLPHDEALIDAAVKIPFAPSTT